MDDLAALRLQIEWGADEALLDAPLDRFAPPPALRPTSAPAFLAPQAPRPTLARSPAAAPSPDAALDLPALHQALDAFHACPLRSTASTTVAPSGNPAAGLVFIAEAPGPEDDRAGHAFSGPPGARLDHILATAGLDRTTVLLAMLVPWRPPGGRPLNEPEITQCLPYLHRLLALTRPRHLVLLGATPLRAIGSDPAANLRRARGSWIPTAIPGLEAPVPALAMLPPDQWLASASNKQTTWNDLVMVREALSQSS